VCPKMSLEIAGSRTHRLRRHMVMVPRSMRRCLRWTRPLRRGSCFLQRWVMRLSAVLLARLARYLVCLLHCLRWWPPLPHRVPMMMPSRSSRSSWGTPFSRHQGMSPSSKRWVRPIGCLSRRMMCSIETGATSTTSSGASCYGFPYRGSRWPLRRRRQRRGRSTPRYGDSAR
jgi:hypothetical protein